MKRKVILIFLLAFNFSLFAQDFIFPPELKWWLDEIQKIDKNVSLEKFEFFDEFFIYEEDGPVSFKNKLYPVLKKWNYFGDMFACYPVICSLKKNRNGKYSFEGEDPDTEFGVFDRNEKLLFVDFYGSSCCLDSFCWVRDNRLTVVGEGWGKESDEYYFSIYDYFIKDGRCIVREYVYKVKNPDLSKLKLKWHEQRSDYFE